MAAAATATMARGNRSGAQPAPLATVASQGGEPAGPRAPEVTPGEPNSIGTVTFLQRSGNRTPRAS